MVRQAAWQWLQPQFIALPVLVLELSLDPSSVMMVIQVQLLLLLLSWRL
uniref:Uncharacterized protein n=1 Tax=Arundo donax TaxID=35708 RepID=A0A0A9FX62_ARUDO